MNSLARNRTDQNRNTRVLRSAATNDRTQCFKLGRNPCKASGNYIVCLIKNPDAGLLGSTGHWPSPRHAPPPNPFPSCLPPLSLSISYVSSPSFYFPCSPSLLLPLPPPPCAVLWCCSCSLGLLLLLLLIDFCPQHFLDLW